MSSLFDITTSDLAAKLVPVNGEQTFTIGSEGDLTESQAQEIIEEAESKVLMRLQPRIRQLCRKVDGEILINRAAGGETSAQTGLFPLTSGTLRLWKNFGRAVLSTGGLVTDTSGTWKDRDPGLAMGSGEFSVNATTGLITLTTALVVGDSLWGEYSHAAAGKFLGIRAAALSLAAVECSRRLDFFRGQGSEAFKDWESSAYMDLDRMEGVSELDGLDLVRDDPDGDSWFQSVRVLGNQRGFDFGAAARQG